MTTPGTQTIAREHIMNILVLDHVVRDRQREACSQAHRFRLARALRAERRARRASESARRRLERVPLSVR